MNIEGLTYAYPGGDGSALRDVSIRVRPGECHVVTGPTGAGKSTLALALAGMLPGAARPQPDGHTGIVFQNPATQLIASSVGAEAAFGLENLCINADEMPGRVREALFHTGLDKPLGLNPRVMSMGEKYRLLIASQLVMGRNLIVLDEPSGQLDGEGLSSISALIARLKRTGVSFAVCEHRPEAFTVVADAVWRMEGGELSRMEHADVRAGSAVGRTVRRVDSGGPVLKAGGLEFRHEAPCGPVIGLPDFDIYAGTRAAFTGQNGAGKTSLLMCMTGGLKPSSGNLKVLGGEPSVSRLRGRVGYMAQDPDAQLFEDSVLGEVTFTLRRRGCGRRAAERTAGKVLESFGISGLAGRSPHRLSYGQKRLVCLSSLMAAGPELLLLDAPLAGLDPAMRGLILGRLADFTETGGTVAATSHEVRELAGWADEEYALKEGRRVAEAA